MARSKSRAEAEAEAGAKTSDLRLPLEEEGEVTPVPVDPVAADVDVKPSEREADLIRSEVNLLVLPFFALSRKGLSRLQEICYHDVVTRGGERVEILWRVTANVRQGFPGPFDKEVHKVVEQIIGEQLRTRPLPLKNPIPLGSLYEFCRRMGINSSGQNYRRIKEALKRITLTGVESRGAFYCRGQERWVEDVFHLYERVVFKGERLEDGTVADQTYLYLGSWYLQNINALYLKPLDYAYYRGLRSTVARRLYELLGVKFYGLLRRRGGEAEDARPRIQYRYSTLCQLLPLTRQRHPSKAREKLAPAHEELIQTGFLADVEWREAATRDPDGGGQEPDWLLVYVPGPRAWAEARGALRGSTSMTASALTAEGAETEAQGLIEELLRVLGDERSRPFYAKLARRAVEEPRLRDLLFRCLSEVKAEWREGRIRNKGAAFVDKLKRYCKERGIDLGLRNE